MDIQCYDGWFDGGCNIYFSANNLNALCCYNIESNITKIIGKFDKEFVWQKYIHNSVIEKDGCLFFLPYRGHGISKFNLKTNEISFVNVCDSTKYASFCVPVVDEQEVYLIPTDLDHMSYKYDSESREFVEDYVLTEKLRKWVEGKPSYCDLNGCCANNHNIYVSLFNTNKVLQIDLHNDKTNEISLDSAIGIGNIIVFDSALWVVSWEGDKCWKCSLEGELLEEFVLSNDTEYRGYQNFIKYYDKLFLLGCHQDVLSIYDGIKWTQVVLPDEFNRITKWSLFAGAEIINEELYLLPCAGNGILKINKNDIVAFLPCYTEDISQEEAETMVTEEFTHRVNNNEIFKESKDEYGLKDFLSQIIRM